MKYILFVSGLLMISILSQSQWLGTGSIYYNGGNVGIGTSTPQYKLDVNSEARISGSLFLESNGPNGMLRIKPLSDNGVSRVVDFFESPNISNSAYGVVGIANSSWAAPIPSICIVSSRNGTGGPTKDIMMWAHDAPSATNVALTIKANSGNIGIGTTDTKGYKLAVNGDAIFTKIRVKQYGSWPDYVFQETYQLPSLPEIEKYIREHKHLPEVPSAAEVEKDGLDLGDNQAALLKKIEELTLYIIEQDKKIEKLTELNKRLEELEKKLEALNKH